MNAPVDEIENENDPTKNGNGNEIEIENDPTKNENGIENGNGFGIGIGIGTGIGIGIVVALVVAVVSSGVALAVGGRTYHNDSLRIRAFEIPRGWEAAPQIGYPRVVVLATNSDGARLLLAAQRVRPGTTATRLADDARAILSRQGFANVRVAPEDEDRIRLDATDGRGAVRQVYVVDGDLAWIVTVYAPPSHQARALKEFDDAVRSLEIAPAGSTPPVDGGGDR